MCDLTVEFKNFTTQDFTLVWLVKEIEPKEGYGENLPVVSAEERSTATLFIGEEEMRNHLNLQQRLFRQALKKSFQNVKSVTITDGSNVLVRKISFNKHSLGKGLGVLDHTSM